MTTLDRKTRKQIDDAIASAWRPPPKLTVTQWANDYRILSSESSAEQGRYKSSRAPYQAGIMDAASDPQVTITCIMASSQVGKTEIINNMVGFFVDRDPCPMLVLQPTIKMAEGWSNERLSPMIRDTPCLSEKINLKSRDSSNTILHKSYAGGHLTVVGANSPASLASRPIRVVLADEVDRYPQSAKEEGDPLSLAIKRTTNFWNKKIILVSTPTVKGKSRIEREFLNSDQRHYYVPCPHCGHEQKLKWSNIVFDKDDLSSVVYACEQGCVIEERDKYRMLAGGRWIAEAEFNGRAGFHISELYSPWTSWRDVVKDFLEKKDTPETLQTWVNTSLGEPWEIKGETLDHKALLARREAYDHETLPDDILFITAAVDTQGDRLEALTQGWGLDKERYDIEHKIFWGDPKHQEVWNELESWLLSPYEVAGRKLKIACALIDSGGHHTQEVYDFVKGRHGRRVFAVKGSSEYYGPIASKPRQVGRQRAMLYICGTDSAKDSILDSSLKIEEPGPGFIHFPHTHDEEFFKGLLAESRVLEKGKYAYKKHRDRNEPLDLHVYNLCAYYVLSPNEKSLKDKRNAKPVEVQTEEPRRTTQPQKRNRKRNKNWVTDF